MDGPVKPSYAVDIETNGLLDTMTLIHCIHLVDMDTKVFQRFDNRTGTDYTEIDVAMDLMQKADVLYLQNGIRFDVPAIQMLYPDFKTNLWHSPRYHENAPRIWDTKVASRVLYPNMLGADFSKFKSRELPNNLLGKHSLEAWGYRLGILKGTYAKDQEDAWSTWNQEMSDYCEQDIRVTANLVRHLERFAETEEVPMDALHMEMDVEYIINKQVKAGIAFNIDECMRLAQEISGRKAELEVELAKTMLPIEKIEEKNYKRKNSKAQWVKPIRLQHIEDQASITTVEQNLGYRKVNCVGYEAGKLFRVKVEPFNPTSRQHIIWNLKAKYGWKPTEHTDGGQPKMDEKVMAGLKFPEAELLSEIFTLAKRLGQLTDGNQAWAKAYDPETGKIYGDVNPMGTISSRMAHMRPNLGQVPNMGASYGPECRALFGATAGRDFVGCDASGIQLRELGHYLARYDDGEYAKQILEGDIHSFNQAKAGLPTRDNAKTFIYGWLFGAGDEKIGKIVNAGKKRGKELKDRFMRELPAVAKLAEAIKHKVKATGKIRALDGRNIPIRSDHSALNFLLQSAEAITMKKALCLAYVRLRDMGADYWFVLNVHDEMQADCHPDWSERVGQTIRQAIIDAGIHFELRIPMDGEYKIGKTWADTH